MPKAKYTEEFICDYCGRIYPTMDQASQCEVDHDLVTIRVTRSDLKAIISFMVSGNPDYISGRDIVQTLMKHNKLRGTQ
jgi:hypothetical protein